jgi:hypothetical protein
LIQISIQLTAYDFTIFATKIDNQNDDKLSEMQWSKHPLAQLGLVTNFEIESRKKEKSTLLRNMWEQESNLHTRNAIQVKLRTITT